MPIKNNEQKGLNANGKIRRLCESQNAVRILI